MQERWGAHMTTPEGYIAELGEDVFQHKFGGNSWGIQDSDSVYGGATLLLVLDLSDPRLASLQMDACEEFPLCSYINCSVWEGKQVFQIIPESRSLAMVHREVEVPEPLDSEDVLPNPLPEQRIRLRKMRAMEYPVNQDTYYEAFETFTGGASFIRILGPPLWFDPVFETCSCGQPIEYIASIGYESLIKPQGYVPNRAFFIGEGALYFLWCRACLQIMVLSGGT